MASQDNGDKNYYSVTWTIGNIIYCWQKKDKAIASPIFSIFVPQETKWKLLLFPRGTTDGNSVAYYLFREKDCNGSENIDMECHLETLNPDGSVSESRTARSKFCKGGSWGYPEFLSRKVLLKRISFPQGILTLRCRITRLDEKSVEVRQIFARTIINVERRSFLWTIQKFSTLGFDQKKCLVIKSASDKDLIKIDLCLSSGLCCAEKVNLNIYPIDGCMKYFTLQTFLLSFGARKFDSGKYENWCERGKSSTFSLSYLRSDLMNNGNSYLPNDVLTLSLELIFSTGFFFEGITKIDFGTISSETTNEVRENWRKCNSEERQAENLSSLETDLMSLYKDQSLCDVKLQSKTNVFSVHTTILSARSPVFRAMFSTDMKEKSNGLVDVSDLDDRTVNSLILFLYTNKLEELKWEDALLLFEVADKYAISSLKHQCSMLLKDSLNLKNACEILILADSHQDEGLKITAQDFILENAKDIFKSKEWMILAETNSKLALETALRNWTEETDRTAEIGVEQLLCSETATK